MPLPPSRARGQVRPVLYPPEVAEVAEELVRQGPPVEGKVGTWSLARLGVAIAARFDQFSQVSHETVRRLLSQQEIVYRQAKAWLTSPDPLYKVRKNRRDRLLAWARNEPTGAAVWLDESWFVRWPYQFRDWVPQDQPLRVAQRWNETVDTTALFAALDDERQEAFLHWTDNQPNSDQMVLFLESLMTHYTQHQKRFVVLFWDKASWHTSAQTRQWIKAYNRQAKQTGQTRLIVCYHPTRSPWLMPLEAIFGWVKHQVLGGHRIRKSG